MSVSDSAKYIRFKEPVANYFTFDSGKVANCTNDLRITKWNGSVETEIPTKIWNETYSGGWCTGATVTWVANVTPAMGTVSEMVNNYEGISSCAWYQTGTTCEMSTAQKYSGTKSLRIRKSTTWNGGYTLGDVYAAPNFYFDPTRNFTYWVYPTSLTNITSVYVQVFGVNDVDVCTLANSSANCRSVEQDNWCNEWMQWHNTQKDKPCETRRYGQPSHSIL